MRLFLKCLGILCVVCTLFDSVTVYSQNVKIFDNAGDTSGDLSGQTDFDALDNRNLTIYWDAEQGNATDWHIYVRKGFGGSLYLGRTGTGDANSFDWHLGAPLLDDNFENGPDFNAAYTFRVIRIDGDLTSDDYYDQSAPVGFNLEGGNEVSLTQSAMPNLPAGKVILYDDLLGGSDLAPMGSSGSDTDQNSERAIQIIWNFGVDPSTILEYHVQVSVDGGDYEFLGQTYSGNINYFWWTPNREFQTADPFTEGPQHGKSYQFNIVLRYLSGEPNEYLESGTLSYFVEGTITPTPTPIETQDLFYEDFDDLSTLSDGNLVTLDDTARETLISQNRMPPLNSVVSWFIFDASAENPSGYGTVKSSPKSAAVNHDFGYYTNAQTSVLEIGETFDLAGADAPTLSFDVAFAFEEPFGTIKDYMVVELLRAGAESYELLDINGDGEVINDPAALGTVLAEGTFDGLFGTSNSPDESGEPLGEEDFLHIEADLPNDSGLKIVFRFESDASVSAEGVYIDNLRVYDSVFSQPEPTNTPVPTNVPQPSSTPTPTPTSTFTPTPSP